MTDIAMPKRHLAVLQDRVRQEAWRAAIAAAVAATIAEDKDCRVLDLGAGAGALLRSMSFKNLMTTHSPMASTNFAVLTFQLLKALLEDWPVDGQRTVLTTCCPNVVQELHFCARAQGRL